MKTSILTIITVLALGLFNSFSQAGKTFPTLEGKDLNGSSIAFPLKDQSKNTLVCLVYSPKTEKALGSWMQPLVNTFMVKNPLDPEPYDINMYFIVMLSGIKNLASDAIEARFKKT